jgi:UPF0755 protein
LARGNRSQPPRERTEEERERDREERARRRAAQAAKTTEDAPAAAPIEPAETGVPEAASEEAQAVEEPNVSERPGEPPQERPAEDLVPPVAAPVEDLTEPPPAPSITPVSEPVPAPVPAAPVPIPPPARRDALLEQRRERLRAGRPSVKRSDKRGRGLHIGHGRGSRFRLTRARVGALIALAAAIFGVWFLLSLFKPFAGAGHGRVIVVIPKDSTASTVGSILARDGVVSSGFFFEVRALVEGKRGELHSGRFLMKRGESYSAAIAALSQPPPAAIPVKVVIPEGENRLQIAEIAAANGLTGSYAKVSERSPLLNPASYGAPKDTPNLEGFLFPATYDMNAGAPASRLVSAQLAAFQERFGAEVLQRARELHITPYQLLTVASMVEREALVPGDRAKIAAVIYNRLRIGMPLGIDATIYYAVEQAQGIATYTGELTESQLHIDSPYNTRTHRGLPPTPISNPGMASIEAAAHPAHVPYLYYVAGADGCGEQVFSTTYAKFEVDAAAYDAAVKKNGGKPPVCRKK